ncbi:MAG: hypothetical protein ABIH20_03550 [Candidatus Diapherotrites archaeon]
MKKGQLSIDLLLAIFAMVLFLILMQNYMEGFNATIQESETQNALDSIRLDVYSTIGAVKAYGVKVQYTIPSPIDCEVVIDTSANGSITIRNPDSGIESSYTGLDLIGVTFTPNPGIKCGDIITITKV